MRNALQILRLKSQSIDDALRSVLVGRTSEVTLLVEGMTDGVLQALGEGVRVLASPTTKALLLHPRIVLFCMHALAAFVILLQRGPIHAGPSALVSLVKEPEIEQTSESLAVYWAAALGKEKLAIMVKEGLQRVEPFPYLMGSGWRG
jgi:hypothetical protein